jgi:hypothetical protein
MPMRCCQRTRRAMGRQDHPAGAGRDEDVWGCRRMMIIVVPVTINNTEGVSMVYGTTCVLGACVIGCGQGCNDLPGTCVTGVCLVI